MVNLDPMAILTLFGLVFGLSGGGQVYDYGFTFGATITEERVVIGVDPQITLLVPRLDKGIWLNGITLGSTILINDYTPEIPLSDYPQKRSWTRMIYGYERGHWEGYGYWGIAYPLQILHDPCRWDPRGIDWGCRHEFREIDGKAYPKRHWTLSLEVAK